MKSHGKGSPLQELFQKQGARLQEVEERLEHCIAHNNELQAANHRLGLTVHKCRRRLQELSHNAKQRIVKDPMTADEAAAKAHNERLAETVGEILKDFA